jgi:hypothetical protein
VQVLAPPVQQFADTHKFSTLDVNHFAEKTGHLHMIKIWVSGITIARREKKDSNLFNLWLTSIVLRW